MRHWNILIFAPLYFLNYSCYKSSFQLNIFFSFCLLYHFHWYYFNLSSPFWCHCHHMFHLLSFLRIFFWVWAVSSFSVSYLVFSFQTMSTALLFICVYNVNYDGLSLFNYSSLPHCSVVVIHLYIRRTSPTFRRKTSGLGSTGACFMNLSWFILSLRLINANIPLRTAYSHCHYE